jgi:hypothetical protein
MVADDVVAFVGQFEVRVEVAGTGDGDAADADDRLRQLDGLPRRAAIARAIHDRAALEHADRVDLAAVARDRDVVDAFAIVDMVEVESDVVGFRVTKRVD